MMLNLAEELIKENLITRKQLDDAKDKQFGAKKPLQEVLVDMGFISEDDLVSVTSKVLGMPVSNLAKETSDPTVIKYIPYEKARRFGVFPVRVENGELVVSMSNPQDVIVLDDLRILVKMPIRALLAKKSEIEEYTEKVYQSDSAVYDLLKNIESEVQVEVIKDDDKSEVIEAEDIKLGNSPVVKLVDIILDDAIKMKASDIHIEPKERVTNVRYRIDGELKKIMDVPAKLHSSLVARIKILANLDIAEKRKTQDGRARISVNHREIDIRMSIIPTFHGEKVVMRLLDTKGAKVDIEKIGFGKADLDVFKEEIAKPQGIILVTGPTGSGKTSTLYAALNYIKSETTNIITIEDPVEYLMDGISQIQVNPVKDVTFANGLRSILRQDPNVILVGEIRDKETAEIAFRSSLTGHLVFSTLHTNGAVAAVTRLLDIGLEPYLVASSIILIEAQRLVRKICVNCKTEYTPDQKAFDKFKLYLEKKGIQKFFKGAGCDKCGFSGFTGRIAVVEMMRFTRKIRDLVSNKASEEELLKEAKTNGMKTMAEAGVELVAQGVTTLEELTKVVEVIEERASEAETPVETKEATRDKDLILVTDDEDDIRKILVKRLELDGYKVIQATNGKECVELATREKPDLIIMDVMMPIMDGFQATEAIRSKLETAVIPILMLTAKKDKESELKGINAGADDYLNKPFDSDKLLARVKMLLKRRNRG